MPQDSKPKGWFSRRYPDRSAHDEAVGAYTSTRGKVARRRRAEQRRMEHRLDVERVMHEQNVTDTQAREVVNTRRHFDRMKAAKTS